MRIPRVIPKQPITHLWERHTELMRLAVSGMRPIDIAEKLKMTPCRVSIIMNSPIFKARMAEMSAQRTEKALDIYDKLNEGAEKGVQFLLETLDDAQVAKQLRIRIAQDFLDRNGQGKITKIKQETTTKVLDVARIEQLKQRREELLSRLNPIVING